MTIITKRLSWWWCQDEACDCTQPCIEEVTDFEAGGPGFWQTPRYKVVTIAEGPFLSPHCGATKDECDAQRQWAVDACAEHGVEFHE